MSFLLPPARIHVSEGRDSTMCSLQKACWQSARLRTAAAKGYSEALLKQRKEPAAKNRNKLSLPLPLSVSLTLTEVFSKQLSSILFYILP